MIVIILAKFCATLHWAVETIIIYIRDAKEAYVETHVRSLEGKRTVQMNDARSIWMCMVRSHEDEGSSNVD